MKQLLVTISVIMFGLALKSSRVKCLKKLGTLCYLFASGLIGFFITCNVYAGIFCSVIWLFFPWLELLITVNKKERLIKNKLQQGRMKCGNFFPEVSCLEYSFGENGFKLYEECGWEFGESYEHYCCFWNAEKKCLAVICHRIERCTTFSYLKLFSIQDSGTIWQTSNFPFSSTLKSPDEFKLNHVTAGAKSCPKNMMYLHELALYNSNIKVDSLVSISSDEVINFTEKYLEGQINFSIEKGIIKKISDTHFNYSFKGLCFLWIQILKDLFRLC